MTITYEVVDFPDGSKQIIFSPEIGWIPMDEANADYQAYLRWVEENN